MTATKTRARVIGELGIGGDWACAHGDFGGLRHVAEQLSDLEKEPLACQLRDLAEACVTEPERAILLWVDLRDRLYENRA